eukprot:1384636-Pyramimonas_sp.AAC.1
MRKATVGSPTVCINNVIDDVSLHAVGGETVTARELAASFRSVTTDLQRMGLPIAMDKLGLLASSSELAQELSRQCDLPANVRAQVHRDLGGGAADGARRR